MRQHRYYVGTLRNSGFKINDTKKQVTKPVQKQKEDVSKKKQASTATISTTMSQMSLDSNNPFIYLL